jgi:hypothetical protein
MTEVLYRPQAPAMFEGLTLTSGQSSIIDRGAMQAAQLQGYYKHIGDLLRPIRQIRDTDVRHAVASALHKHGRFKRPRWAQTPRGRSND